ncbi:MAG: hypothetical protein WCQ16_11045 [Verrucomicrobiae bacterium]
MNISTYAVSVLALVSLTACKPKTPPAATAPVATPVVAAGENRPERGQAGGSRGDFAQRSKERFEQMKTDLALTDDQAQKISAIMDQRAAFMRTVVSDQSLSREQRMAKFQEARQAFVKQVEPLLTTEQKAKWEEQLKKREADRAERRGKRTDRAGGGQPPQQ